MTNEERIESLSKLLSKNGWFDSVGIDSFGKMVVFIHYATKEVMNAIPNKFDNKNVVWQYATSKSEVVKAKYASAYKPEYHYTPSVTELVKDLPKFIDVEEKELDINFLTSELDRLEKLCGSKTLQDIFYEVHDGKNAVTNLKVSFPEIYDDVLDLYEEFGFDNIYNELDG